MLQGKLWGKIKVDLCDGRRHAMSSAEDLPSYDPWPLVLNGNCKAEPQ